MFAHDWIEVLYCQQMHMRARARVCVCVCARVYAQSCPTLCNPMDCSLPCTSVHGIFCKNIGVGCHFLLQGIFLPDLEIEPESLTFPALAGVSSPLKHLGSPFLGRIPQNVMPFPVHPSRRHTMSVALLHSDHLFAVMPINQVSHCKVTIFPFA